MSMFTDPRPAMPFFSLPLGSTRPLLVQMPNPCCKLLFQLHSPIPKLMTGTHHQGCFTPDNHRSAFLRRDDVTRLFLKSP
jgi:hypothetical protein